MTSHESRGQLRADLIHIAEETRLFKPPYIPSRYLQDLSNSDPVDLVRRYVLEKAETSGFERLWLEKRLDLTVENVAWKYRHIVGPEIARAAAARLAAVGFDVHTQRQV
jgi:hypothetical protein